jgi:hypothetical protein
LSLHERQKVPFLPRRSRAAIALHWSELLHGWSGAGSGNVTARTNSLSAQSGNSNLQMNPKRKE